MGHAMSRQAGEVAGLQIFGVADLDAIAEAAREAPRKSSSRKRKSLTFGKIALAKVPNSKISTATRSAKGSRSRVNWLRKRAVSRNDLLSSPAFSPYLACLGHLATVIASGTFNPKLNDDGVPSNSPRQ